MNSRFVIRGLVIASLVTQGAAASRNNEQVVGMIGFSFKSWHVHMVLVSVVLVYVILCFAWHFMGWQGAGREPVRAAGSSAPAGPQGTSAAQEAVSPVPGATGGTQPVQAAGGSAPTGDAKDRSRKVCGSVAVTSWRRRYTETVCKQSSRRCRCRRSAPKA